MSLLFISHSSLDNGQAIRVRDWLKSEGWSDVFLDLDPSEGLAAGHRWQQELKRAGENCAAVIVLISPNWLKSRWCQTEFLVADQLGKRIFPIIVAETPLDDLPIELKASFQIADISTEAKAVAGFQSFSAGLRRAGLDPDSFEWPPRKDTNRSIYRGLQSLDVTDAAIFFGRDAAITKCLDELRRLRSGAPERMLIILGASGAGKSSFLRAGLIARLSRDAANFIVLPVIRPENAVLTGSNGLNRSLELALGSVQDVRSTNELSAALADVQAIAQARFERHAAAARETYAGAPPTIVIAIDQAEELFGGDAAERECFLEMLAGTLRTGTTAFVVATIRSDAYAALQKEPALVSITQSLFNLPALSLATFKEVIEGPARLARPPLKIEPALSDALLHDLGDDDALPLLAFTLERLYLLTGRSGVLTLADYRDKLGGLAGAIASAVNEVLGPQPDASTLLQLRRAFIPALVSIDQEGVKRRVALESDIPADVRPLIDRFVDQHMLIRDVRIAADHRIETIEVTHEAILRQWPALRGWIAEEEDALRTLNAVRAATSEWETHLKDGAKNAEIWLVHRGARLEYARSMADRADFSAAVDRSMRDYLAACHAIAQRSQRRRAQMLVLAAILATPILATGALTIWHQTLDPLFTEWLAYRPFTYSRAALAAAPNFMHFQDCRSGTADCPLMVVIPSGRFMMGTDDDVHPPRGGASSGNDRSQAVQEAETRAALPRHAVMIKRFAASAYDVTFDEWQACVRGGGCLHNSDPSDANWGRKNRPVISISWEDANEYVRWLSAMTGVSYGLLSEAQWEYAARAGSTSPYWWGDTISTDRANYDGSLSSTGHQNGLARHETLPVGSFRRTRLGCMTPSATFGST
jgi:formylglycine-generating enzyme required for sulfatase activity